MKKIPEVDAYIATSTRWSKELSRLREIVLQCELEETLKWRAPCYTDDSNNILMLGSFKDHCALSFFKGVLLKDAKNVLEAPGANSQSVRLIRFTSPKQVTDLKSHLRHLIRAAVELERAGAKVELRASSDLELPAELEEKLRQLPALKAAFERLTPGRKRGYVLHINGAKLSSTRSDRIEKHIERILAGKGIHDCICGLSAKLPRCDGSHQRG